MFQTFTKALALVVLSASIFTACKKDKDESLAITKENLVGTYVISSVKMKSSAGGGEQDVTNEYVEPCEKDDETLLKSDGTYEVKDAGTACDPSSNETGNWSVSGNTITIDGDPLTIKSLSKGSLVLEESYSDGMGNTLTITSSLSRK